VALSTRPARTTPAAADDKVGRLAALALLFHDRHTLCDRIDAALAALRRSGVWAVVGESELLGDLRSMLAEAKSVLGREEPDVGLLYAWLGDVVWEVAREVDQDLAAKVVRDREMGDRYAEELAEWQDYVTHLVGALREARAVQAPIRREQAALRRLDGMVTQVDRMLKERNFTEADRRLRELSDPAEWGPADQLSRDIPDRIEEVRRFSQQADLLLLRSPDQQDRLHYTVLLRTPSEPGTVGVNIEAASTLAGPDSARLREAMARVTEAVNSGLVRGFSGAEAGATRLMSAGATPNRSPVAPVALNELIRDVGDLLYRLVIPEQIHPYLTATCSLTITTNDLELPWELMLVDDEPLCARQPVARMPMGRALPRRRRPREGESKLRFLLVHADPDGSLSKAGDEVAEIERALTGELQDRIEVVRLRPAESSGERLNDALRGGRFDVIHYAGHAAFDKTDGDLSGLLLHEKEVFFAQKIRRLVEGRPLVFLNACESGMTANEKQPQRIDRHLQLPAEGLASAFIYGGAVGCIGSIWPVFDGPAAAFAISFYKAVLDGYPLGEAMRRARELSLKEHPNQVTWATFVLYGDPRYRLVD
jgi:hypothetical protein